MATLVVYAGIAAVGSSPALADSTQEKCLSDGSLSTHVCIRLYFQDLYSGSNHYVKLTRVQATANRDSGQVSITSLKVGAEVSGRCYSGCQTELTGKLLVNKSYPTLGTWYGGAPPWSSYYTLVGGVNHQCGVTELSWKRGTASYSYTADLCVGAPFDTLVLSDRERGLK